MGTNKMHETECFLTNRREVVPGLEGEGKVGKQRGSGARAHITEGHRAVGFSESRWKVKKVGRREWNRE